MKSLIPYIPQLIPAVAALLGAIVGGSIVGGFNVWLAMRREKAEKEQARLNRMREFVTAARLIWGELLIAEQAADAALKTNVWIVPELSVEEWRKSRSIIAAPMAGISWQKVYTAFVSVDWMNRLSAGTVDLNKVPDKDLRKMFTLYRDSAKEGISTLKAFLDESPDLMSACGSLVHFGTSSSFGIYQGTSLCWNNCVFWARLHDSA